MGFFTPDLGILFTRKRGLLLLTNFPISKIVQFQRGNSQFAHLRGNSQPRTLDLARDVMQLPCTSSLMDGTIRQGFNPSCRIPTTRAAMTSPAH